MIFWTNPNPTDHYQFNTKTLWFGGILIYMWKMMMKMVCNFQAWLKHFDIPQLVDFPTHNKGYTLDLILTGIGSDFNIISVNCINQGQLLSEYCSVITFLDYPKQRRSTESVSYRKWTDIDVNNFIADIHIDELKSLDCSLEDLLGWKTMYREALDKYAPIKHITSGNLSSKLQYNKDLLEKRK